LQGLREFKRFARQIRCFVVRAVHHIQLQLDRCEAFAEFCVLAGERVLSDFLGKAEVEEAVLLLDEQRGLTLQF